MLETPKALSTQEVPPSKNLKDVTMDNQQETKTHLFVLGGSDFKSWIPTLVGILRDYTRDFLGSDRILKMKI